MTYYNDDYSDNQPDDDGGPAFPRPASVDGHHEDCLEAQEGMSRRDWLAGLAMQAILSNPEVDKILKEVVKEGDDVKEMISKHSYKMADTMVKEGNR